ncbi:hypothetical protein RQP46_000447 [Phenoliferia psychrophenolica]
MKLYQSLANNVIDTRAREPKPDLLRFLLGEDVGKPQMRNRTQLITNQFLVLLGADAISTTITATLHFLLAYPPYFKRLQAELDSTSRSPCNITHRLSQLSQLPFLNACIKEALRLVSPFPSALTRIVGREGLWLSGRFVQGGTTPTFTLQHSSAHFSPAPSVFLPERWLPHHPFREPYCSSPEPFVHDTRAWIPFGHGSFACPGQDLVMDVVRLVLGDMVQSFDMTLEKGDDTAGDERPFWAQMDDDFLATCGKVSVLLKPRR